MPDRSAIPFLPYGRQSIDDEDIAAVSAVLKSDFLTTGPAIPAFEKALGDYLNAPYVTACTSGTAALHLALAALKQTGRLKEGDAVIVPSMTFVATANCIDQVGAKPVFADCDPTTGLMNSGHAEEAFLRASELELRVRGIIPVHMSGQTADLSALRNLADRRGLFMIEDAAHAIGTRFENEPVGSGTLSDLTCFSFHPVKTMTMGEGGAVTTADSDLHKALQLLRSHGITRNPDDFIDVSSADDPWYYEMHQPGLNYRATDFQCALGMSQLRKLDRFIARRQDIVDRYDTAFRDLTYACPLTRRAHGRTSWHLYPLLIDFEALGTPRRDVMALLKEEGIGTQVHYIPVHRQPYYRRTCSTPDLPGTDTYYARALAIPLYPDLTDGDVQRVIDSILTVLGNR